MSEYYKNHAPEGGLQTSWGVRAERRPRSSSEVLVQKLGEARPVATEAAGFTLPLPPDRD